MSLQPLLASDEDGRTSGISVITERCTTEDVFVLWGAISWIENLFKESIGPKNKKNDEQFGHALGVGGREREKEKADCRRKGIVEFMMGSAPILFLFISRERTPVEGSLNIPIRGSILRF